MHFVFRPDFTGLDDSAGMRHAGRQPHQHRNPLFFGEIEGVADHRIRLLLGRRLEAGHHGKFGVETGILFILRGVHGRIVASGDDQSAVGSGHGGIDKSVGTDVHADMLHAYQGALAGVGYTQRRFHGRLFIAAPVAVQVAFPRQGMILNEFRDLGRRCTGICIDAGKTGVEGAQGERFIPQKQMFFSHISV